MRRFRFLLLLAFSFMGCEEQEAKSNSVDRELIPEPDQELKEKYFQQQKTISIKLTDLEEFPDEIGGCTCYFSRSKQLFDQQRYAFASSMDSIAILSINNHPEKLRLVRTSRVPDTFINYDYKEWYKNENYRVTVTTITDTISGDETWSNHGTVRIESKDGQTIEESFFGECGC